MSLPLLQGPALAQCPEVRHGFTTRVGGIGQGPHTSLDLGTRPSSDPVQRENWDRVSRALDPSRPPVALLQQVHGREVLVIEEPPVDLSPLGAADAVVTALTGVVLAVRVADCVPVLLSAPGAIGAAHAGWRGLAGGVLPATVEALCDLADCGPDALVTAVGPHATVAAYEVGPEVIDGLVASGLDRERIARPGPRGRDHADLGRAARDQLEALGVGSVDQVSGCTLSESRFFSHRRDGPVTGRQAGVIVRLKP